MNVRTRYLAALLLGLLGLSPQGAVAQLREQRIIESSATVLDEIMSIRFQAIPSTMLAKAEAVVIIPNVIKGGFVVGARHGKGVLLIRAGHDDWELPVFISLTGGNIGWQVGLQSTDLILVFKTRKSVEGILHGKLTLGADAAAAAGPVGRQAAAATDGRLQAEIYSYSRSRGLFAGVSVDGSVLRVEPDLNATYYQVGAMGDVSYVPESALQLVAKLAGYCQPGCMESEHFLLEEAVPEELPLPAPTDFSTADVVRPQLAAAASRLAELLDPQWMTYLAIPHEVFQRGSHPSLEAVQRSATRLDAVAADPQYADLTKREEFHQTRNLLREYERLLSPRETALRIPPPPVVNEAERVFER
jgi:lipid-binding SYLF domain-containing protein